MKSVTPVDALKRAIKKAGGQSALARRLSERKPADMRVSHANVWNWLHRDLKTPAEHCPDIEAVTGVKCEELCPDANWSVLRGTAKAEAQNDLS